MEVLQNTCNTALELRAQCLPYMESSELCAFHIWKVLSYKCCKGSAKSCTCVVELMGWNWVMWNGIMEWGMELELWNGSLWSTSLCAYHTCAHTVHIPQTPISNTCTCHEVIFTTGQPQACSEMRVEYWRECERQWKTSEGPRAGWSMYRGVEGSREPARGGSIRGPQGRIENWQKCWRQQRACENRLTMGVSETESAERRVRGAESMFPVWGCPLLSWPNFLWCGH